MCSKCRYLNDSLRKSLVYPNNKKDKVMFTSNFLSMDEHFTFRALAQIMEFDSYTPDNDPYGEHDVTIVTVDNETVIAKIDYYDNDMQFHSPNKEDSSVTVRVLTVMLGSDY